MSAAASTSSTLRRFLLHNPLHPPPTTATANSPASSTTSSDQYPGDNSFDANVVMVLSVLLCALICSLGLNSIIRCALRCSNLVASSNRTGNNVNNSSSSSASARLANTGVKRKAVKTFPIVEYSAEMKLQPGMDTECIICLSEFTAGELVRLLPKCNHGFHVRCIDKWLSSHSSCPKCRHNLIETCQKIVGYTVPMASSSDPPPPVQETIVITIAPLQPEGFVRNYREINS